MIIKQTLASALLLLKHSDMEICFRINNDQRLRSEPSPVSGESPVGSAGSYERHFVTIVHGSVRSYHLKIHRLRFKASDGSRNSHAFLMDIMKPHSSYSLRFILNILYYAFFTSISERALCESFGISSATLHTWKRLSEEHIAHWISALKKADQQCSDVSSSSNSIPVSFFSFLCLTGSCFLQGHWSVRKAYPTIMASRLICT